MAAAGPHGQRRQLSLCFLLLLVILTIALAAPIDPADPIWQELIDIRTSDATSYNQALGLIELGLRGSAQRVIESAEHPAPPPRSLRLRERVRPLYNTNRLAYSRIQNLLDTNRDQEAEEEFDAVTRSNLLRKEIETILDTNKSAYFRIKRLLDVGQIKEAEDDFSQVKPPQAAASRSEAQASSGSQAQRYHDHATAPLYNARLPQIRQSQSYDGSEFASQHFQPTIDNPNYASIDRNRARPNSPFRSLPSLSEILSVEPHGTLPTLSEYSMTAAGQSSSFGEPRGARGAAVGDLARYAYGANVITGSDSYMTMPEGSSWDSDMQQLQLKYPPQAFAQLREGLKNVEPHRQAAVLRNLLSDHGHVVASAHMMLEAARPGYNQATRETRLSDLSDHPFVADLQQLFPGDWHTLVKAIKAKYPQDQQEQALKDLVTNSDAARAVVRNLYLTQSPTSRTASHGGSSARGGPQAGLSRRQQSGAQQYGQSSHYAGDSHAPSSFRGRSGASGASSYSPGSSAGHPGPYGGRPGAPPGGSMGGY